LLFRRWRGRLEGIVQPPYPAIELDDQPFHQPDSLLAEQYQRINRKRALRGNPCSRQETCRASRWVRHCSDS
jgi:hypothetical protein